MGEIACSQVTIEEALSLAKGLNDMHGLAVAVARLGAQRFR